MKIIDTSLIDPEDLSKRSGLLCNNCNIRMAVADDKEWLSLAMAYKEKYNEDH